MSSPLKTIEEKLCKAFSPLSINVLDTSSKHEEHEPVKNTEGVTHVEIKIVSECFEGIHLLERHRRVYAVLKEEMLHIHSISIDIKAPTEVNSEK
ncbi:BolA family protein [Candidatus Sneabacter namystus]|uniref:BolA family transcriptional regulator n=1 Tax=Candidatus Sneabacter namystus TaxID=2601646 RepID=A0A5C0UI06_9RICK|nr:BolA family protein [Candidatus Sneabacter namystus]QEK39696.1 BolA family transcriptional regulator [Candidatus Sneabacter namystus]